MGKRGNIGIMEWRDNEDRCNVGAGFTSPALAMSKADARPREGGKPLPYIPRSNQATTLFTPPHHSILFSEALAKEDVPIFHYSFLYFVLW
jgi:hypothetical protein